MTPLIALEILGISAALVAAYIVTLWVRSLFPDPPQLHGRNDSHHLDEIRKG